jgi:hypothetical protein
MFFGGKYHFIKNKLARAIFFIFLILFSIPCVFASPFDSAFKTLSSLLGNVGKFISFIVNTPVVREGVVIILGVMFFYSTILVIVSKLPIFQGHEKQVKLIAVSISGFLSLALWYLINRFGGIAHLFMTGGVFAMIILCIMVFFSIYYLTNGGGNN